MHVGQVFKVKSCGLGVVLYTAWLRCQGLLHIQVIAASRVKEF